MMEIAAALGATIWLSTTALTQGASAIPSLDAGVQLYWNGEYEKTVARLEPLCAGDAEVDAEADVGALVECLKYLAMSHIALGDEDESRHAFRRLLAADPAYRLDDSLVSPKVLRQFERAAGELAAQWFDSGKQDYYREDYRAAIGSLERVLMLDPDHALAREYTSLSRERRRLALESSSASDGETAEAAAGPHGAEAAQAAAGTRVNGGAARERGARIVSVGTRGGGGETPVAESRRIYRLTSDIERPVLETRVDPEYPQGDRLRRRQGTVVLSVVIDEEGRVSEARVIRSVSDGIDRAAVEAVTRWRYRPATRGGRPVSVYGVIQLSFQLD